MNSKINLWKDKKIAIKYSKEEITQNKILEQEKKCEEKFEKWQRCIKLKSWNDEECVGQLKPKYEYCIQKKNVMQTILDDKLDEEM
jgi:hypothetical protein